jgi:hypothetical protein
MDFKFISPVNSTVKLKATIHRTGKLGFTLDTIKELQLDSTKWVKFALNNSDKNDKSLYMFILTEADNESFPVIKAGDYLYINTTNTFENMDLDFKKNKIFFTIIEINENNQKYYKLIRKESERKERGQKKF